ncbi:GNAT family N-acetyltransferase [Georgenia satyanarayanai]|uniref:GNAT family N-acetyltransferase n=1 Tax=Georgenia satyanarayanai TaxID=860221 RepID=UPI00203EFD98|nr:GNAT family protein [Georgenia satyanarayanai]MCM3659585.1 GNAT family N-acetyltransferase [Georgenia satyanarayanai]
MAPSPWAHKPVLTGTLTTLRPYRDADLPHILEALADPELLRLTGSVHSDEEARAAEQDPAQLHDWYSGLAAREDRLDLMVVDRASGTWVGEVVLNDWDPGNESCNFRILLGPRGRDRGLGSEATRLLLDHAFTRLPLHRVSLGVYAFNPRAQRVYEKAGFVVEGREREALRYDGARVDQVLMSVLRPDWAARQRLPPPPLVPQ